MGESGLLGEVILAVSVPVTEAVTVVITGVPNVSKVVSVYVKVASRIEVNCVLVGSATP